MTTWNIVGALALLGTLLMADAAFASGVPAEAGEAADACSKVSLQPRAVFARPSDAVLCMQGVFVRQTLLEVREIPAPGAIKTLVINSDGGWTEAAIELAKLAEHHHWLIVVNGKCLSSCANYVFLSRTKKV